MTNKRHQISDGLEEIGACYAVRTDKFIDPNDPFDSKPLYHIHPDRSYPHQQSIKRFSTLDEILEWIAEVKSYQSMETED